MNKLQGVYTAIITPFKEDGSVDFPTLEKLVRAQITCRVDGVVPIGTTGESPTLSKEEQKGIIRMVVRVADHNVLVIPGIGSNNTKAAVEMAEYALEAGADAGLSVIPYYNKPTQKGHIKHQLQIADVGLPLVVYNIPSRCGSGLTGESTVEMAQHPNIVALKAAAGIDKELNYVLTQRPVDFSVLSGDDGLTYDMMMLGADGVVSVISNIIPAEMVAMVDARLNADVQEAKDIQDKFAALMQIHMHLGTNPEAIKESIYHLREQLGVADYEPVLRSPLLRVTSEESEQLRELLSAHELL